MGIYSPVTRDSDGETIRLDKEEAEQSEINMNAKQVVQIVDNKTRRSDYDSKNRLIYQGYAKPGTATSVASWFIIKFTYDGDSYNETSKLFADGDTKYDNKWTDRESLNYS